MERIALCLLCLALLASPSRALPERAGDWRSAGEDLRTLTLTAGSEDVGRWTRRFYRREAPPGTVEVNLTEGPGPGPLRVPEAAETGPGLLGEASDYRTLQVAGRDAVLEVHPLYPAALAVAVSPDAVLTLEGGAEPGELVKLAEDIIADME